MLHVRRHLDATNYVPLPQVIKLDGIAAPTNLLAMLHAVNLETNPPDVGARHLFKDARSLRSTFLGMGFALLKLMRAALEQSGPRSGTSTNFGVSVRRGSLM